MPRNGSGTMSVPTSAVPGATITSSEWNTNFDDMADEITNSLALDGQSTMTGQLKLANGTVAAPGLTFGSDTDSGWYRIGADNWGLAMAGAKVLDVSATGLAVTGNLTASGVTDTWTVTGSSAGFVAFEGVSTEAGAAAGPILSLYRNSATPAASDVIGSVDYAAKDSGNNKDNYVRAYAVITDPTSTSEDAEWRVQIRVAGSLSDRIAATAAGATISGTASATALTASAAITGATAAGAMIATQTQMEAASATDFLVTPGRQHFHPSACKAWVKFTGSTGAILASYNVDSVTRNAQGDYTVLFTTAMSSSHYHGSAVCSGISGAGVPIAVMDRTAAGADAAPSTVGQRFSVYSGTSAFAAVDPDRVYYEAHGDL